MGKAEIECYDRLIDYVNEAYLWADTDPILQYAVTEQINGIIIEIKASKLLSLEEQFKVLLQRMEEEIVKYLFTYNETEIAVALLFLKAQLRTQISLSGTVQKDYELVNRHSEILQLIKILLKNNKKTWKGKSILKGSKNLATSFRYAYYLNVIMDNIEMCHAINRDSKLQIDLFHMLREGCFYTDEYNDYMDSILKMSEEVIPEEAEIQSLALRKYLKKKGCYIDTITGEVDQYLYDNLKLTNKYLTGFCFQGNHNFADPVYCDCDEYIETIKSYFPNEQINFDHAVSLFSLNKLCGMEITIRDIELRSIYQIDNRIIFYPFDLCWNISCFQKFLLRNQFTEMYFKTLSIKDIDKLKKQIRKTESKISTYLAYVIAEQMWNNGYCVPQNNGIPLAEIHCIITHQGGKSINLLKSDKDYGDIDVLAADSTKKQIYNIELKYFKPLINLKDLGDNYKVSDRDKYIKKAQERENIIRENMSAVLALLEENENMNYTVRTIVVSPRPDYWLKTCDSVEYMDWVDFLNRIRNKNL